MTTLRRSMVPITWVINRLANIATNGDGNGLPRHAFGNAQILRHRRQQAHRQKLNGNQAGDAERHGENRRPVGARNLFGLRSGRGLDMFCHGVT
jgi:hypothetical protein